MKKIFYLRDLEINKIRKFYAGIFFFSEAKIFSITGLRSKFLTWQREKRASKMRRACPYGLLFSKSLITLVFSLSILQSNPSTAQEWSFGA
ncbi:MAG: hypothetical protein AAF806_32635, partial [Bacteroidota bacterium]